MKEIENKCLNFVLKHYQTGKLDTNAAIRQFRQRHSIHHRHFVAWYATGIAASLLVCVVLMLHLNGGDTVRLAAYEQVKTYVLPDSTTIILSPYSSLSYESDNCREVKMTGKIFFRVKHDERHPFNITSSMAHVTVLGTQFQVCELASKADVFVVSGKVRFSAVNQSQGLILTRGMQASLRSGDDMPRLVATGSINQTAWATHKFVFERTPLPEVLDDLSAYYHVGLMVDDGTDKTLSGEFSTDSLDEIVGMIENVLNVDIQEK